MQYREKVRAPLKGVVIEASVIGNMQETLLSLLEGRNQQTVVRVTVGRTQAIHTSHMWKTKDKNCGTLSVDLVQAYGCQMAIVNFSDCMRFTLWA